jgi:histidine triad (HIT) family protein
MPDCLFCKIVAREMPAKIIFEDDALIVIQDINPQAPLHALVIPRRHIATLNDITSDDDPLVGRMVRQAGLVARERGLHHGGYRTVFNCNRDAGQTVFHVHLHVLAGRVLRWPPG